VTVVIRDRRLAGKDFLKGGDCLRSSIPAALERVGKLEDGEMGVLLAAERKMT